MLLSSAAYAQILDQAIRFTHDNDLYFLTDKHYSAGTHFEFSKRLASSPKSYKSLTFTFGQDIFTPTRKSEPDTTRFDRPFAGWFFLNTRYTKAAKTSIFSVQLQTGLTGSQAFGDKVQRNYHEFIGEEKPIWYLQIPNDFHANVITRYRKGFLKNALFTMSSASLGTRTTFLEQKLGLFLGSHSAYHQNSVAGLARHQDKEWFLSLSTSYQYVFFNSLIEGALWNKTAPFTTPIVHHKLLMNLNAFYRWNRNSVELNFHFNSKETPKSSSHTYAGITLSHYF